MAYRLFKKQPGRVQVALTAKLLAGLERIQRSWADYMAKKTNALSPRGAKRYLFAFCMILAFFNTCVLSEALQEKTTPAISPPAAFPRQAKALIPQPAAVLTASEQTALRDLHRKMDSLSTTPAGKASLDSFLAIHPGFKDSLLNAEQLIK